MHNLVLYCKSYYKDVDRVVNLSTSIEKYNIDNLPFYISVPSKDLPLFKSKSILNAILIEDEVIDTNNEGWAGQQVIKSQFWKLGLSENYVCLDSDSTFIKPFTKKDFMYNSSTPYTICHEQKDFFEFMYKYPLPFNPQDSFKKDRLEVMDIFGREGTIYDFGPSPTIWSNKVWESLYNKYIKPNGLSLTDLILSNPSEFTWYGEWLLQDKTIPLYPRQPLFKVYHYEHQYNIDKQLGYTIDDMSQNYLGVILQSNWGAPLKY